MMRHDQASAAVRVVQSLTASFEQACLSYYEELAQVCESPIEAMLGLAFLVSQRLYDLGGEHEVYQLCRPADYALLEKRRLQSYLVPQFRWQEYRIDWMIDDALLRPQMIFVECDGHNFHNITPEQAQRDRARDRAIQAAGVPILRFTGAEIYRDAGQCANAIFDFVLARYRDVRGGE